jgi:zinc D-Ala-D-Ala carboxypeptidase
VRVASRTVPSSFGASTLVRVASPRGALVLPSEHPGALGEANGALPDGATVFDDDFPAVAILDPALLGALRQVATDAAGDGVEFFANSGWRSREYQEQLVQEAVSEYGSEEEAARWVATAPTSPHVSGDARDLLIRQEINWLQRQMSNERKRKKK